MTFCFFSSLIVSSVCWADFLRPFFYTSLSCGFLGIWFQLFILVSLYIEIEEGNKDGDGDKLWYMDFREVEIMREWWWWWSINDDIWILEKSRLLRNLSTFWEIDFFKALGDPFDTYQGLLCPFPLFFLSSFQYCIFFQNREHLQKRK